MKTSYCWAIFFSRWILGLTFLMAGWFKAFEMGPSGHAELFFVQGFAESWIPAWLLWILGVTVPFVELIGGAFLLLGLRVRETLIVLGFLLVMVTYGHLLQEALFSLRDHIFPRAVFLIALLVLPRDQDRWALDNLR